MDKLNFKVIVILGATAGGKTRVAACLAKNIDGEIISADSRQVYRHMSIGTGKDIDDYNVDGYRVPYHLVDIVDPGYKYNVYEYQQDCIQVMKDISGRWKKIIVCGGTGMYIEAVLKGYRLIHVPPDPNLRRQLEDKSMDELTAMLSSIKALHNVSDTSSRKRLTRAIEIASYYEKNPVVQNDFPKIEAVIFGIKFDRDSRRKRITMRLKDRLKNGMIEETESLLKSGLSPEQLIYYGLEYKFLTLYLTGKMDYQQMFNSLNTAIHQFAKRQMTWFRKMERDGIKIHWIDGYMPFPEKLKKIATTVEQEKLF